MITINAAADRFFRSYFRHCTAPDEDTLFNYLNALHSFNDKLYKSGVGDFFDSINFLGLKALRNLFHHEAELLHEVKIIPTAELPPIVAELMIVCLVERSLVERAARQKAEKQPDQVLATFHWYGPIADIQSCVFNAAVDVFEKIQTLKIEPSSEAYFQFKSSYHFEEEHGHSHRVTGEILCRAGDVDEILQKVFYSHRRQV